MNLADLKDKINKIGIQNIVIGLLSIILLYVLYRSVYSSNETIDNQIVKASNNLANQMTNQMVMFNKSIDDLKNRFNPRELSILKSLVSKMPHINVVNRRPIILTHSLLDATNNSDSTGKLMANTFYCPFRYASMIPPAPGAKRKWRLYSVYSDNLGPKEPYSRTHTIGGGAN